MYKFKIVFIFLLLLLLSGCSVNGNQPETYSPTRCIEPELTEIRSICNLATLDCYYHNVAISHKPAGTGWANTFETDRTFWIEYSGIVKVGIDLAALNICINSNNIVVTLPPAKILAIKVDETSINENSMIASADSWLNKNPIEPEDQTEAIRVAQDEMLKSALDNAALLMSAQSRAKDLIEIYISQIAELSGIPYEITWIYES